MARGERSLGVKPSLLALAALLAFLAFVAPALAADRWTDISDARWVETYKVTAEQAATVAEGFPDGSFHPNADVTRGQFAKMAVHGLQIPEQTPATATFVDVPTNHTFFSFVEGAYASELITGYRSVNGTRSFFPADEISRQQANSILGRFLSGLELVANGTIQGTIKSYVSLDAWYRAEGEFHLGGYDDESQVDDVHRAATAYLVYRNVVEGDGMRLKPRAFLSRAQAVTMVLRVRSVQGVITTPPPAPVDLNAVPAGPSSDPRPYLVGKTVAGGEVQLYDTFNNQTKELAGAKGVADSDGDFSIRVPAGLEDGQHVFRAKVKSPAGLVSLDYSAPVTYVLDRVAPSASLVLPADGAATQLRRPIFTATASDSGAGIASVTFQYRVAGATEYSTVSTDVTQPYEAVWGDIQLADGGYEFRTLSTDRAGNQAVAGPVDVVVDLLAPTVQLQAPVATGVFYTESLTPLFAAAAGDPSPGVGRSGSGVARVDFLYRSRASLPADPGAWTAADFQLLAADDSPGYSADPAAWSTGLAEGRYVFAVQAFDLAGNASALDWQEVVVDRDAPVITVTAPAAGATLADETPYLITWSLTDVSGVETVAIEYATSAGGPWTAIATAAPNTGSREWLVPNVTGSASFWLRFTAVDLAGPAVEDVAGHTRVVTHGPFTVAEAPAPPTGLTASDPDNIDEGLSGLDFKLDWTPSPSQDAAAQWIYILPAGTALDLEAHGAVALLNDPDVKTWTGGDALGGDSRGAEFDPTLAYQLYVVTIDTADAATPSAAASWPLVLPAAPTAVAAADNDTNPGVDGRDLTVAWTPSSAPDVVAQYVYVLPTGTALVLTGPTAHKPVATIPGNTTAQWSGAVAVTQDSALAALGAGSYTLYVAAENEDGRLAAASAQLTVVAP